MVSSIGSGSMGIMNRPDPQDLFKKIDTDGSGGVSQAELKAFSEDMEKKAGKTLDADDTAFTTYDTDSDGTLSTEELNSLLENNNPGPSASGQGMAPPPPPDQAAAAYTANSGDDSLSSLISSLQSLLDKLTADSDGEDSASSVSGIAGNFRMPDPQDFFNEVDSDGSGGISQSELKTLAENMASTTGGTIDTGDDAFNKYDVDGDGSLSQDELKTVMDSSRPEGMQGQAPPPPPPEQVASASSSGSLQDQISALRSLLEKLSKYDSSDDGTSSVLSVTT